MLGGRETTPLPAFLSSSFHFPSVLYSPAVHIISYTLASELFSPDLSVSCNDKKMKRCSHHNHKEIARFNLLRCGFAIQKVDFCVQVFVLWTIIDTLPECELVIEL